MDRFVVSARKYRPQHFDTVVGQAHITTTLKNAIRNEQLAHAFLFCGPRGVGKTTCARILAKTINCSKPTKEGEACDKCESCTSFREGGSINYFELDAASNNSVDDIRTLTEQVRFAPQGGRYKVYVIDEVHMLSTAAFNAFLKTLEEPPSYAIFILATTEKHKILPTILSRCQIFDFRRITTADTVAHLESICKKEKINAEKPALQIIAQKSEGCMRDALSLLDKIVSFTNGELKYAQTLEHLNILDEDYFFRLLTQIQTQDLSGALLLFDEINQKGFEGELFLGGMAEFTRNLLVCQDKKAVQLLDVVESFKDRYQKAAVDLPTATLISMLNLLTEAEIQYKSARNKRLFIEMTLIRLCYLQQALTLSTEGDVLVKKKMTDVTVGYRHSQITPYGPRPIPLSTQPKVTKQALQPRLTIDEAVLDKTPPARVQPAAKLNALSKIRAQFKQDNLQNTDARNIPLEVESLTKAWKSYTQILREAKNPAGQPFDAATLRIIDENSFEVLTSSNIEQRFVEAERNQLYAYLQEQLHNRALQFSAIIQEKKEQNPTESILTSKERYHEMVKHYPLVQQLKERLRLDLDY